MPFPNPDTQWKPGESGNPAGVPRGTKHISTWIQELLSDEAFEAEILDGKKGLVEYKGAPIKAIIIAARHKAVNGDDKAREWLAKYGWSTKVELTGSIDPVRLLLDKFGVTEGVENDRQNDEPIQGSSKSGS